jgi:Spy/CpxP family protein refolding chaperone
MKTKAIVATLLIAAAASADARFASPYPRKAVPPDESGHWMVINGNQWRQGAESELATLPAQRALQLGEASPSGGGPDRRKIAAN